MSKRLWGACLALAMGWTSASGPRSEAKPPDLPVHPDVVCPEGRAVPGGFSDHEGAAVPEATDAAAGAIPDLTWFEGVLPALAGQWAPGQTNTASTPKVPADVDRKDRIERFRQAQRIYTLGLEYQQSGHLTKARTCFQEAHLISPETRYGRLAIERLHYLETQLPSGAGIEEAEEPGVPIRGSRNFSNDRFQEMMRDTAPLGTVPLDSY